VHLVVQVSNDSALINLSSGEVYEISFKLVTIIFIGIMQCNCTAANFFYIFRLRSHHANYQHLSVTSD